MKKATIILALLFAAATTHALAWIDWEVTGRLSSGRFLKLEDGNTSVPDGWSVYLIMADTASQNSIKTAIEDGSFNDGTMTLDEAFALNGLLDSGGGVVGTPQTAKSPLIMPDAEYEFAIFYFNEIYTGAEGTSGSYFISEAILWPTYDLYDPLSAPTQVNFGYPSYLTNGKWYYYAIPYSVPEPSTMALLVLGVAALGSRRRVRK